MKTALLLVFALLLITACSVSVDLGEPIVVTPVASELTPTETPSSTPTPEPSPTTTDTPTPPPTPPGPPSARVLKRYLLTLDDLPSGYVISDMGDEDVDLGVGLMDGEDWGEFVSASVIYELDDSRIYEVFEKPLTVAEGLMWFNSPKVAQATYLILEAEAEKEMTYQVATEEIERLILDLPADDTLSFRVMDEVEGIPSISYVIVARKGPYLAAMFVVGADTGVSDETVADLARLALAKLD